MSQHYLLDGYNVLYALREMPTGSWEQKRDAFLQRIVQEKPYGNNRITVIFDSREGPGGQSRIGELQVVYTSGETADDWISQHVRRAANPRTLVVVTDDQGLRRMVRGTGAKWLATADFWRQVKVPPSRRVPPEPEIDSDSITDELRRKWL